MWTLFRNGGFPMFFIVAFGLIALVTAFVYAVRPRAEHEGFIKLMSIATLLSVFSGTCGDIAAVGYYVGNKAEQMTGRQLSAILLQGMGECTSPGIFGFTMLSLVALMCAVGKRRLDARRGE